MVIKWNKTAIKQLMDAITFIEENDFYTYAEEVEAAILSKIRELPANPAKHPVDKYRRNNDGSYHAFEVKQYRVSYRHLPKEIRIVRIRHTSRQARKY